MTRIYCWAIVTAAVVSGVGVEGNHNYLTRYAMNETMTIDGRLTELLLRNPHSFVHVEAPDHEGRLHTWVIEWHAAALLDREGVTRETLKTGDRVVVVGNPGRKEEHALFMNSITRPADGWTWGGP